MLEWGTDADALREMIGFAAERLMEPDVQALCRDTRGAQWVEVAVDKNRANG
ncbi:hypothetical protein QSG27_04425 [Azospirillum sp. C340-1]|uniref:Transposase n=1 Tax=Azospirillum isscasi TaxID=3053926 RepID=A0ABU0WFY6_9PROT|nr:hypothetical protein [Azospirillum isscasi]